jgi:uncharacterized protein YyaL (SSP411 family)
VILGVRDAPDTKALRLEVWKKFLPNKVVVQASPAATPRPEAMPLLEGRTLVNSQATAFVCEGYTCKQPVTRAEDLASQLLPAGAAEAR